MSLEVLAGQVDKFDTRSPQKQKIVRRPVAITPMMVRRFIDLGGIDPAFDLARDRIAALRNIRLIHAGDGTYPDKPIGNEQVRRRTVPKRRIAPPKLPAVTRPKGDKLAALGRAGRRGNRPRN